MQKICVRRSETLKAKQEIYKPMAPGIKKREMFVFEASRLWRGKEKTRKQKRNVDVLPQIRQLVTKRS